VARNKGYHFHTHPIISLSLAVIGLSLAVFVVSASNAPTDKKGFNEFGYNETARLFVGKADGVDRNLDGTVWGDPTYANDRLNMNWNEEWDRGKSENWSSPPYEDAWLTNNWNGKAKVGSGEMWQYKIKWIGSCGNDGASLPNDSYCIWGQFAVVFSQGTVGNKHFWDAHAKPNGLGQ
jgi:hypothetical protein